MAAGAARIRSMTKRLSDASVSSVDWDYMEQFLDLESHANYKPVTSPSIRSIDEPQLQFEDWDLNPLPAQVPQLPQQIQQIDNDPQIIEDRKIFNNMPGFLISAIQKLKGKLRFEDLITEKTGILALVR